jgi:hypothetical protein
MRPALERLLSIQRVLDLFSPSTSCASSIENRFLLDKAILSVASFVSTYLFKKSILLRFVLFAAVLLCCTQFCGTSRLYLKDLYYDCVLKFVVHCQCTTTIYKYTKCTQTIKALAQLGESAQIGEHRIGVCCQAGLKPPPLQSASVLNKTPCRSSTAKKTAIFSQIQLAIDYNNCYIT